MLYRRKQMNKHYEALELDKVKDQIASYCAFSLGKQKIRQLEPNFHSLWVEQELQRVKEAFQLVVHYGNPSFQGLHDIQGALTAAQKDITLRTQDLLEIAQGIHAVTSIKKYFKESEVKTIYLQELIDAFVNVDKLAFEIEDKISTNGEVKDDASSELKQIRKSIRICEADISKEIQRFISRNASKLMDTITTIRNDRVCVLVKISEKNSVDGFIHGESASGQTAYIEPKGLLILNNRLQSLKSQEQEEIQRILYGLSQLVKQDAQVLLANLETFALLDSIFARGIWAKMFDGCVADLQTSSRILYIKNARHPLIDQDKVVANTYTIAPPHHHILITGSNTGGKTVTLKTIGLFVLMTMCGMAVSAQEASIPMVDGVYVDIGDAQSIQESLSTFSSHISNIANICKDVSASSLVLLDELGGGTDPKEGESLAIAVFDDLRKSKAMVVATTHYSALKTYASEHEDILISSVEFDMDNMKPTYRYIEGMSGHSYAFAIAKRYGLKESIITQAKAYKEQHRSTSDIALEKLEQLTMEQYEAKEKIKKQQEELVETQKQLQQKLTQLEKEKEQILQTVREQALQQIEKTKEEAEEVLTQLKSIQSDVKPHELAQLQAKLSKVDIEEEKEEETQETFAVGDYVQLKKLNYYGEILSIKNDKVCVLANHMKMNTTIYEITHAKRQVQKKTKSSSTKSGIRSFSLECNVIGMRVAEAVAVIDKYLDNAILAKVSQVRIIHGMGTGKLRKGVHDYLKRNSNVESYMMGGQGEGGLGATIVKLKRKK